MNRAAALLALVVPVLAFAALLGWREAELREAAIWRIPVTGADPLDQLRGRYAVVQLDWKLEGPVEECGSLCTLCLETKGTTVLARVASEVAACPARLDTERSRLDFFPATRPIRREGAASPAPQGEARPARFLATVYLPEARADDIETRLNAGETLILVARLTRDGRLVPDRLEPAPPAKANVGR